MSEYRPNGAVLWQGPSLIDGSPIVVIATGLRRRSGNAKTGAMVQTWILRQDRDPLDSVKDGTDRAICGDCPQRPSVGGACYVRVEQAPKSVWKAYRRGRYPHVSAIGWHAFRGRTIRFGAYGDPGAVPAWIWIRLTTIAGSWTGYTHQWTRPDVQPLRHAVMASVDGTAEADEARARGWRTFRVAEASELEAYGREFLCPASKEAGKRTDCASCRACDGSSFGSKDGRASVFIAAHGAKARRLAVVSA